MQFQVKVTAAAAVRLVPMALARMAAMASPRLVAAAAVVLTGGHQLPVLAQPEPLVVPVVLALLAPQAASVAL